jgi:hypothetical protein
MGVARAFCRRLAFLVCAIAFATLDALGCDNPERLIEGAATIVERQPMLNWTPVPGATAYKIRLQSRVPNGRVLAQHDAVVNEPRFVAPQPLADYRTKVTVRLSAVCGKEASAESVSWFVIDTALACSNGQAERRAYAITGGRLTTPQELRTAPHVQSTRPHCTGARGEARYRIVVPN